MCGNVRTVNSAWLDRKEQHVINQRLGTDRSMTPVLPLAR
jgi:hypothetical protein